ncbi:threonine synthase [Microbacterium sp. MAHUQ-60]|uniref:threonine synthase n=1 Tax=unclassified Microbacterium TaxID=2609290 RepID=UPI003613DD76
MSTRFSYLTSLVSSRTGEVHDPAVPQNLAADGSTLFARYDLDAVREAVNPDVIAGRAHDLWRYHELLPVQDPDAVRGFGEGMTPLIDVPTLGRRLGLSRLKFKDESLLPTGTFKARGAAVGVARAAELGIARIAMPTNGNAGAAWASYSARYGIALTAIQPIDAPRINRSESSFAGAEISLIDGLISDAGKAIAALVGKGEHFDVSTLKEPYRVEGKKTMGLEIAEQLGWRVPDVILYPTGGGVGLIGIHKAILELQELGWIEKGRMPRLVSVQAEGCDPIVRAFESGAENVEPLNDTSTIAFGVNVPSPVLGAPSVLNAVRSTGGTAVRVSDEDTMAALHAIAEDEGILPCPEGAATIAAAGALRRSGWIAEDDEVVLLNTGAGNKYGEVLGVTLPVLDRAGVPTGGSL